MVKDARIRLDFHISESDRRAIARYGFTRGYADEIEVNSQGLATDRGVRTWMEEQLRLILDDIGDTDYCVNELGCQGPGGHAEHLYGDGPVKEDA